MSDPQKGLLIITLGALTIIGTLYTPFTIVGAFFGLFAYGAWIRATIPRSRDESWDSSSYGGVDVDSGCSSGWDGGD